MAFFASRCPTLRRTGWYSVRWSVFPPCACWNNIRFYKHSKTPAQLHHGNSQVKYLCKVFFSDFFGGMFDEKSKSFKLGNAGRHAWWTSLHPFLKCAWMLYLRTSKRRNGNRFGHLQNFQSYNNRPRFRKVRQLLIEIGTSFYHSCFSPSSWPTKKHSHKSFSTKNLTLWGRYLEVHVTWAEHGWIRCGTEQ